MKFRKTLITLALIASTGLIVACGDDKDPRLSNEDIAYIKQKRLQELYGGSTTTMTSTEVRYVTITNTVTVTR